MTWEPERDGILRNIFIKGLEEQELMDTHDDDIHDVKPPDGLLAERELAKEETPEEQPRRPEDTSSPALLPVDPNYQEPTSVAAYVDMADKICRAMHDAANADSVEGVVKMAVQRETLLRFAIQRIMVLEGALLPFAQAAMTMANSQMCLTAQGSSDPPGGMWISNPSDGIQLMPNAGLFFSAIDVVGRQRVQDFMEQTLHAMQAMSKLRSERDQHIENGGSVH